MKRILLILSLVISAATSFAQIQDINNGESGLTTRTKLNANFDYLDVKATASGTDTYTATPSPAVASYVTGQSYFITFTNANTGAATLNLNGLGAKAIRKTGTTALSSGDIKAGQVVELIYDGTNLQIIGDGGATGGGGITNSASSTQLMISDGTNATGDANLTWDGTNDVLTLNGIKVGKFVSTAVGAEEGLYIGNGAGVTTTATVSRRANVGVGTGVFANLSAGGVNIYDGAYSVGVGYNVLNAMTTGSYNTAIGYQSMALGQTTAQNTAVGWFSLRAKTAGGGSTAFGYQALAAETTGGENTAVGRTTMGILTTGTRNVGIGPSLQGLTTGSNNTVGGSEAFERLSTQSENTGWGYWAGVYNRGAGNTAVGAFAFGQTTTDGAGNTASYNSFFGNNSGRFHAIGDYNTWLGYDAGTSSTTTIQRSIAIGANAKVSLDRSFVLGSQVDAERVNYGFGGESYGGGEGVAFFKNAVTNPSSAPTSGFLLYSNGGIATIRNAGGTASAILANPMTTQGDIIYGGTSGAATRLAAGTVTHVLTSNGAGVAPSWQANPAGFSNPMTTEGDIILATTGGAAARLGIGANGTVLTSNGTTASWTAGGSGWATTGTTTLSGAATVVGTSTNTIKFKTDALGVTQADGAGLWLANTTAAAAGAQQISPSLVLEGQGWKTNATAASQSVKWKADVLPVQGAANPTATLQIASSINGGAYVNGLTLSSDANGTGTYIGNFFSFGSTAPVVLIGTSGAGTLRFPGSQGNIQYNLTSVSPVSTGAISLRNANANATMTSGTHSEIGIGSGFAPTSGTAIYNMVVASQTINQTGGANGAVSFYNIAPVLTAAGGDVFGYIYNPTVTSIAGKHHAIYATEGGVVLNGDVSPAQITADQNNYTPTGLNQSFAIRLNSDASRSVTGIAAGDNGEFKMLINVGAQDIVLVDESASSTAANRFALNANITLQAEESIMVWYDGVSARWRVVKN